MLLAGKTPAQAAHAVGVARQTAYTWKAVLDEGGIDALRAIPSRGRPARLDEQQLQALGRMLLDKPTDHGFGTELWTLKRVGVLIERQYGVKFGQTQIWRILGGLGFSVQKPERRAIERDEDAVLSGVGVIRPPGVGIYRPLDVAPKGISKHPVDGAILPR
jgi:transposase